MVDPALSPVPSFRIATWNIDWASPRSRRRNDVESRLAEIDADVLVLTETTVGMIPKGWFVAEGGLDWGYPLTRFGDRRKIVLCSKWPIQDIANGMVDPPGRHVRAIAETPAGTVRIHGVCIPWSHAHVSSGRRDRKLWSEHQTFIASFRELLQREETDPELSVLPLIVAGDFNQKDGGMRPTGTSVVRDAMRALRSEISLTEVTSDGVIDKIAVGPGLSSVESRSFAPPVKMTHHAVSCVLQRSIPPN